MSPAGTSTKPDKLLLDEMFSPRIGELLCRSGIDCRCVVDDYLLRAQDDATVLDAALGQGRALVTNNVIDFEPLRRSRPVLDQSVAPLIYTDDTAFPRSRSYVGLLAEALAEAAGSHLGSAYGGVLWLSPPHGRHGQPAKGG